MHRPPRRPLFRAGALALVAAVPLAVALVAQAPPPVAETVGPAWEPAPRSDRNSQLAHQELLAKAKAGGIDVYFIGDSITRRWGALDYPEFLAHWRQTFFGWNAGNFGWGADRIENMLWRLDHGELDGVNPKVIVILAGTNNIGARPGGPGKVEEIARGIQAIIDRCRLKAPAARIILTAIFPRNDNMAVMPEIAAVNARLAQMADGTRVRFLNVNDRMADADGRLFEGVAHERDKLHLTLKGYQIWADGLSPILTEWLGPRAATDHAPPPTGDPSARGQAAAPSGGASPVPASSIGNAEWTRPFPAFRLVGNVYWVGTYDLSSYLITTRDGHILINTGMKATVPEIAAGVAALGFRMTDVKVISVTHAHWDHAAGLAELKRLTGASVAVAEGDVDALESGGRTDFRWGNDPGAWFDVVRVDRRLKDGDRIALGEVTLTAHHHPGHTKGATSFTFDVTEGGKVLRVGIMNLASVNPGVTLAGMPGYPTIGADYAKTFERQRVLELDVFLASHASQFRLHQKYQPGGADSPTRFVDPDGYRSAVAGLEKAYQAQLAQERAR